MGGLIISCTNPPCGLPILVSVDSEFGLVIGGPEPYGGLVIRGPCPPGIGIVGLGPVDPKEGLVILGPGPADELVILEPDPMTGLVILKSVGHCGLVILGAVDISVLGNPTGLVSGGPVLVILAVGFPIAVLAKGALLFALTSKLDLFILLGCPSVFPWLGKESFAAVTGFAEFPPCVDALVLPVIP